ncbi:hypothetical protein [Flavobacterium sp.]|uniref:hypothetical protein n=1 Tax=Flavobacterium sp. TaxID=239 RepID=UPI0039E4A8F6
MKNPIVLMAVYSLPNNEEVPESNYLWEGLLSSELSEVKDIATVVITKPEDETDYEDWRNEVVASVGQPNRNLTYGYDTEGKLVFVNLLKIENDEDHQKKVKWLKKYQDMIDYVLTGLYTEAAHSIAHPEEVPNLFPAPDVLVMPRRNDYNEIQVGDLKELIDASLASRVPPIVPRFDTDRYDNYVEIEETGGNLVVSTHPDFPTGRLLFSIPFLRSIIRTHDLDNSDVLVIGMATFKGKQFQYIWVKGTTSFYNYSNEPR